ncbi:hypothetical protein [Endozoicomonas sp.]|uniref:hypothetical protein n=1 Tax=Endozoicomonas sp. TaxID=1892382 RepID=UPI003AF5D2BC
MTGYSSTSAESDRVSISNKYKELLNVDQNHSSSYSSSFTETRATRIQRGVDTFLSTPETGTLDITVFRRLLENRFVSTASRSARNSHLQHANALTTLGSQNRVAFPPPKVLSDHSFSFSSISVEKRAAQILQDICRFLSSPHTNTQDGKMLNRLLENRFVGRPRSIRTLTENFERIIEEVFDSRAKTMAADLLFKGILRSDEYQSILSKPCSNMHQSTVALLDILIAPSVHRSSPEQTAIAFEEVLSLRCPALARKLSLKLS